jgi:hypothetical protein
MKSRRFIVIISIRLDGFTILILVSGVASEGRIRSSEFRPIAHRATGRKAFQLMIGCS